MLHKNPRDSEYITGDQPFSYRKKRGSLRNPKWKTVEQWRQRWDKTKVSDALTMIGDGKSAEEIGTVTGFGAIDVVDVHGNPRKVPDLRGLDVTLLPRENRILGGRGTRVGRGQLDFSYFHLEGARLTDMNFSDINFTRANLQKATLRRVNFNGALLVKAHLQDADLRDAELINTNLAHIRYTEDSFLWRGTILMETHLSSALYVDPVLEKYARDQYFLCSSHKCMHHFRPW